MAEFTPSKKTAQDFNNGVEYINEDEGITGDAVQAETINNLVESALYTQEQAENAVSTASGAVGVANNALAIANSLDEQIKTANATANSANSTSQEAKDIAEEAREIAQDAQKGVGTKVIVNGSVVPTFDADTKVDKINAVENIGALPLNGYPSTNTDNLINLLQYGNEFNFADYSADYLWLNYRGGRVKTIKVGDGGAQGGLASMEMGGLNVRGGVDIYNPDGGTIIELGRKSMAGLEFHCQGGDAYVDYDALIQAVEANRSDTPQTGKLRYLAREHRFVGDVYDNDNLVFSERNPPKLTLIYSNTGNISTGIKMINGRFDDLNNRFLLFVGGNNKYKTTFYIPSELFRTFNSGENSLFFNWLNGFVRLHYLNVEQFNIDDKSSDLQYLYIYGINY